MEYQALLKKLEKTVEEIETSTLISTMLESILQSIVQEYGKELGIIGGRIYEQADHSYQLISHIGTPTAPPGYAISMEDRSIQEVREKGQIFVRGAECEEPLKIGCFAAISIGENDEYLVAFTVSEPVDEAQIQYSLTLIRHVSNYKIRVRRLESYISEARKIQQSLLPTEFPKFYAFDIYGRSFPAEIVGGDLFDMVPISDTILGLAIADASGHGLPAALQVRDVFIGLRMGLEKDMKIVRTMQKLNSVLSQAGKSHEFITMFYAELEDNGNCFYCNAGHHPPLFFGDNNIYELSRGGLILGPYPKAKYERGFVFFDPGNILVMYTDGVTEATNPLGEEFGADRIIQIVQANRNASSQELCDLLFKAVNDFSASAPPKDDRTLFIVKKE